MNSPHLLAALVCTVAAAGAQSAGIARPYADHQRELQKLSTAHPSHLRVIEIGRTSSGRTMHAAVLGKLDSVRRSDKGNAGPETSRPAVLLIAGLDGRHAYGGELVLHHVRQLLATPEGKELLEHRTIYAITRVNIDGIERRFSQPALVAAGNAHAQDNDRDRRTDEDGPNDLDGDGLVAQMRMRAPDATLVGFGEDMALLRTANAARGEQGVYKLITEGHDDDGDGLINEDGPGGVIIDRNFPHRYTEHTQDGGLYAGSEPETRAVMDFCLSHRNITLALVYGPHDNLRATKIKSTSRAGAPAAADLSPRERFRRGRTAPTSWLPDDQNILGRLADTYRESTKRDQAIEAEDGGTFGEWAYYQAGIITAMACIWSPLDSAELTGDDKERSYTERIDMARLMLAKERGAGFLPWKAYQHPSLGAVELGGFVQGALDEPDAKTFEEIKTSHDAFFRALCGYECKLALEEPKITASAPGVYEIEVFLRNDGDLGSASAMARRARTQRSPRVVLNVAQSAILAGERVTLAPHLNGLGGRTRLRWIVQAAAGSKLRIDMDWGLAGLSKEILLP